MLGCDSVDKIAPSPGGPGATCAPKGRHYEPPMPDTAMGSWATNSRKYAKSFACPLPPEPTQVAVEVMSTARPWWKITVKPIPCRSAGQTICSQPSQLAEVSMARCTAGSFGRIG